jgi:peroxiredoxin
MACATILLACEDEPTEAGSPSTASENRAAAETPPRATASAAEPPPKFKEFAATSGARLGTLPDDIGIAVGTRAPTFELETAGGETLKLDTLLEKQPLLLVFYRGGWCPYCNFQIRALKKAHQQFVKRGVQVVAVSVDKPSSAKETQASYEIPFPVLSDPELEVHRAFHVDRKLDTEELERLKKLGTDIERYSGKQHHTIAVPSLFLIDKERIVRWAHADLDYKTRPTVEQLLAALDTAGFEPRSEDAGATPKND